MTPIRSVEVTMSVNMNVFVARSPAGSGAGLPAVRAEQRIDPLQVERRAELLEHASGGQQVAPRGRLVALGRDRLGVAQARPGALVRQVGRAPQSP